MFMVMRGIAAKRGMPHSKGCVWGHDMVVNSERLMDPFTASALTYVEVLSLTYESLCGLLKQDAYESVRKTVKFACVYYTIRNSFIEKYCPTWHGGAQASRGSLLAPSGSKKQESTRRLNLKTPTSNFDPDPPVTDFIENVQDMQHDLDAMKADVASLRDDMAGLKDGMAKILATLQPEGAPSPTSGAGSFKSPLPPLRT